MEDRKQNLEHFPVNIQEAIKSLIQREGELYELDITGETADGQKELSIFLKQIINNEDFKVYSITEVYAKEAFVYNDLSHVFADIQNEVNIPEEHRFKTVPSHTETSGDAIILENIVKKGYRPGNRFDLLTLEVAEKALLQLAKFHALSFALENKRPEYFEKKIKTLKQSFLYNKYWRELILKMCDVSMTRMSGDVKERLKKFILISFEKYPMYMTGAIGSVKCLCHGDFKMNNIFIKEEDGAIREVIPIDYQQIYMGNPIIDLIYFIYSASNRSFRKEYSNHLKDYYYGAFAEFLKYFNMDANAIFPKDTFDEEFNASLDYGLMFCLYMYPFLFASEDDSPDGNDDLSDVIIKVDERFYDRIQGVVDDFIELGIL